MTKLTVQEVIQMICPIQFKIKKVDSIIIDMSTKFIQDNLLWPYSIFLPVSI